ncbi:integrase, catalytic region, zinc finger, CCHC-type containing protein [Tanacetum coccineum]
MGTVCFGNDNFAAITGYGDYVQDNLTICHVYYVEGLGHNLFSVGQFCYGDLEVAFRSNNCFIQNLEGEDLLTGSYESNLYTISISEMAASSLVRLMSKATFKYDKDHLCSACEQGKSKKATFPSKLVPSTNSKLELLHMDLCGPMRAEIVNGKRYILVIVDDYSRSTWVYFFKQKVTPEIIMKFITQIQRNIKDQVLKIGFDNGTEFKNATLKSYYEKLGIVHHTSIAQTPQQNGVVEHTNIHLLRLQEECLSFQNYQNSYRPKQLQLVLLKIALLYTQAMASECNNSGPGVNCLNFQDSSEEMNDIPSQQDLDNLFGPLYEEYYTPRTSEVSDNSIIVWSLLNVVNTLDNEDTPSSSSIIVEDNDASQIATSSEEPIVQESSTPVLDTHSDEQIEEDIAELDGNTIMHSFGNPKFKEAESSSNY